MSKYIPIFSVVLLIISISSLQADIIHVPSQHPTIQAGIDAAVDGDTVLVADGTYTGNGNRDIDFNRKAIFVMSEEGPAKCIIDCGGYGHRGFYFHGEGSNSVVRGFTITNGYISAGGGIACYFNTTATIIGNIIKGNRGREHGGGIYCYNSSPTITNNNITGNTASLHGAGIYCRYNSSPIITDNTISGNRADTWGGGIDCAYFSHPTILGNTITHNRGGYGGGIRCSNDAFPIITWNTITGNIALEWGGGIACSDKASTIINNTILWDNNATEGNEIWIGSYNAPSIVTISYSDVEGGATAVFISNGSILNWGDGIIDEDPLFVLSDKNDYRLLWDSPCIDSGDPTLFDPDSTRSDMGSRCFNQNDYLTLYLTPDTTVVSPGEQLSVTYTAINRWSQPELFWVLSQVTLPGGNTENVVGPYRYNVPADKTIQKLIVHEIPVIAPDGMYEYRSLIGIPPGTLYDIDSFKFWLVE